MKPTELTNVTIDGLVYPNVSVYGLAYTDTVIDHSDEYGFGVGATVITDIDFDLVVIHLYGGQIEVDSHNKDWQSVKKQVAEHILDDHEYMADWQNRELGE